MRLQGEIVTKRVIETDVLMRPIAHFSHAVRAGNVVHIGATAGTDATRRLVGNTPGLVDAKAQIRRMFDNVDTVLGLLGACRKDLVRIKSYITDTRDLALYSEAFNEQFAGQPPSHAVVGSPGFPLPQAAVELDAVAILDEAIERLPLGGVRVGLKYYCTALPVDSDGRSLGQSMEEQSRAVMDRLSDLLRAASLTAPDVVNVHVTLGDVRDYPAFEAQFKRLFRAPYPSRTVVVAPLSLARMRIQLESVALAGGGRPVGKTDHGLGAASPAVLAGKELFVSAQLGTGEDGQMAENVEDQTRAAWQRIAALLKEADMGMTHVLRTNNVLTDWRDYGTFNAGYGAHVAVPYPPRTTVVAGLLERRACVQIEAIAHADAEDGVIVDQRADTVAPEFGRR